MEALLTGWRRYLVNGLLSGGYLVLLLVGVRIQTPTGWLFTLALVIPAGIWAWHANLKRYRMIVDTPTSRAVSAPQGYVELVGRGHQADRQPLLDPIHQLPCLWYRFRVEVRRGNRWYAEDFGESNELFGLDDGSGQILVDPENAEIVCTRKSVTRREQRRYTLWSFIAGETLYVLGEHTTPSSHDRRNERNQRLGVLLHEWKQAPADLIRRFDTDGDGRIDLEEWDVARKAAERAIDLAPAPASLPTMRRPRDGRPYLIANRNVTELARHYRRWSYIHLVVLAAAAYGLLALT